MKKGTINKMYYPWEKDKPIADIPPDFRLDKEMLCYWLYWLRGQVKEAKIWSGANDEMAYKQVRELIKKEKTE